MSDSIGNKMEILPEVLADLAPSLGSRVRQRKEEALGIERHCSAWS